MQVRQLAYYVPDIDQAAREHSRIFGSGPFFTFPHVPLVSSVHRGVERAFDHSSAYGQWGDLMVEFVALHSDAPSAISDVFPKGSGRYGLHHAAIWVEDLDAAITEYEARGIPLAQYSVTAFGTAFAFLDATASLGHMIELYARDEGLESFYAMVRDAARGWDGSDPVRPLEL
ncbi:MAG: hypothetical protein GVX90_00935 [Alphaproteobacteria bacterium]|nr:hypothetical protein [Alphaproteobacteria bacterium]